MKKAHISLFLAIFLILFAGLAPCAFAEDNTKLLCKETFMEMESISSADISPDGKHILFSRSWVDKINDRYRSNLWLVDIDGTRPVSLPMVYGRTLLQSGLLMVKR